VPVRAALRVTCYEAGPCASGLLLQDRSDLRAAGPPVGEKEEVKQKEAAENQPEAIEERECAFAP